MQYINEGKHYSISYDYENRVELGIWIKDPITGMINRMILPLDQVDMLELINELHKVYNKMVFK